MTTAFDRYFPDVSGPQPKGNDSGLDTNPGTLAAPWKTLAKAPRQQQRALEMLELREDSKRVLPSLANKWRAK